MIFIKRPWESRAIQGAVLALVTALFGIDIEDGVKATVLDNIGNIIVAAGTLWSIRGSFKRTAEISFSKPKE